MLETKLSMMFGKKAGEIQHVKTLKMGDSYNK